MRQTWLWTGLVLALIAGGSFALYLYLQAPRLPDQVLYANGHIEGTEIRVAAEISGRVVESGLAEGVPVSVGAVLVRIDDTDLVLSRQQAAAEVEALQHQRERAERELQIANHHMQTAEDDLARYTALYQREATPQQRVQQAEDALEEAMGQVAILEAEIATVDSRIEAAQTELSLMDNRLAKTQVAAPIDGTILTKAVEVGEYVQPGQTLAVLVDLSHLELRAFIPESDIGKIVLDAPTRVRIDAFPDRLFDGRVARIDQQAQFTPRDIHMPQERTRMVFGVTIALDNPDGVLKPGMPADAWLLWQPDAGWPERLFVPG